MPELPEVETIVRQLNRQVKGKIIRDVWSDWPRMFRGEINFSQAKNLLSDKKILKTERKGKNILIHLSHDLTCWVHLKMTGHFLIGKFKYQDEKWQPLEKGPLNDAQNRFIHLVFTLNNGAVLALSDLRKFARITVLKTEEISKILTLEKIGLDPLDPRFNARQLKLILSPLRGKIKNILMDQQYISGIGNIYASEILWKAKINPWKTGRDLDNQEITRLAQEIKEVLQAALRYKGTSVADDTYRMLNGKSGGYIRFLNVYQREGEPCPLCGAKIKREKMNSRSTFYCPHCQK